MTDLYYSFTLVLALLAAAAGMASTLVLVSPRRRDRRVRHQFTLLALSGGALSLGFGLVSAVVHLRSGHGPGSLEPLSLVEFFTQHEVYWFVLALSIICFIAGMAARRV